MKIVDLNEGKLDLPPVEPELDNEKPPIAQDFTDNPFSQVEPVKREEPRGLHRRRKARRSR